MLEIFPLESFSTNYIWVLLQTENQHAIIIDPGVAEPVINYFKEHHITLSAIFITHHHADHTGGVPELLKQWRVPVYGPYGIPWVSHKLQDNEKVVVPDLNLTFTVFAIPGHTIDHIAFYGDDKLFPGDTLFSAGCGKIFEGTAEQMFNTLQRLKNLPDNTLVYPGHEYTLDNLRFAKIVEPDNKEVLARWETVAELRTRNLPTLPTSIYIEKLTNPFLRTHINKVQESVLKELKLPVSSEIEIFAFLRSWKNNFV